MTQKFKTRDGGDAVVFGTNKDSKRPYIGAYWTGEEWMPTTWKRDGTWYKEGGHPRGLDLMLPKSDPSTIIEPTS